MAELRMYIKVNSALGKHDDLIRAAYKALDDIASNERRLHEMPVPIHDQNGFTVGALAFVETLQESEDFDILVSEYGS